MQRQRLAESTLYFVHVSALEWPRIVAGHGVGWMKTSHSFCLFPGASRLFPPFSQVRSIRPGYTSTRRTIMRSSAGKCSEGCAPDLQLVRSRCRPLNGLSSMFSRGALNKVRPKGGTACCPLHHINWATSQTAEYAATTCFSSFQRTCIQATPRSIRTFAYPPHRS